MKIFSKLLILLTLALFADSAHSAETVDDRPLLQVGTRHAPPFAYQDGQGQWRGLSISLVDHLAQELGFRYQLRTFEKMDGLLDAAASGTIDLAAAAITITPGREERMDFSHPFHFTGLGIAVPHHEAQASWMVVMQSLVAPAFLSVIASLSLVLFATGVLMWLAERRHNEQFPASPLTGIGSGFWWSAVTMTTVGYGDKAPMTLPGRLVGLVWMFAGLIIVASFTAQITSSLTLSAFNPGIAGAEDLDRTRVGVVATTTANHYAENRGLRQQTYSDVPSALRGLAAGEVGAVIHDHPLLNHHVRNFPPEQLMVLENTFERQDYGLAMPLQSPLRKEVNQALIDLVTDSRWQAELGRYGLR